MVYINKLLKPIILIEGVFTRYVFYFVNTC